MTLIECKDDIANGLANILWSASHFDDGTDFDDLLDAIRVLRPAWAGGSTASAWRYLRRQAWTDARRVLDDDVDGAKRSALHTALMAVCLFGLEDPLWQSYARTAVEQREDARAAAIGNTLLTRADKSSPPARVEPASANAASTAGGPVIIPMQSWVRA
ncbi:hypothetical protein GWC77_24045 [Paraburkholderia sp. NMBU_R16]|uniref:HrpB1 family type III secretion system apparatus protein n=1 Tax=Paraburkholderia sp. NMBU_R16 TaxID=2698676 RepID=UPI0015679486|nr:hypothetical protein [Paraburkholderia sp. NMBU_R16]